MKLEDYFDFHTQPVEYIRLRGTRIDIDHVIEMYRAGNAPEEIAGRLPTLSLVQVYATITYYLQNQDEVHAYLQRREKIADAHVRTSQRQPPSDAVKRIRAIKAARVDKSAGAP